MKKLNLTPKEREILNATCKEVELKVDPIEQLTMYRILKNGTKQQIANFWKMQDLKSKQRQIEFRKNVMIPLVPSIVKYELQKGIKGLSQRLKAEWGEFAEMYDLKKEFNEAFTNARDQQQQNG